jgi:hypothetical protein
VSDGNYATSSFNFNFSGTIESTTNTADHLSFTGVIKKNSGGEPFARIHLKRLDGGSGVSVALPIISGALSSNAATISADVDGVAHTTGLEGDLDIERIDSSNELCFRLVWNGVNASRSYLYEITMSGPRQYNGTLISSSNGTEF